MFPHDPARQRRGEPVRLGQGGVTEDPLVSSDIVGDPRASVVQLDMTRVVGGDLAKVMCWYDNEWGFTNQMVRQALQELGLKEVPAGVATS